MGCIAGTDYNPSLFITLFMVIRTDISRSLVITKKSPGSTGAYNYFNGAHWASY